MTDPAETVARWFLWNAYERACEEGWEAIPDITEADYDKVVAKAAELLPDDPTVYEFDTAYKALERRVSDGEG